MDKTEAQEKIRALLAESNVKVEEAMKLADEHGLEFKYEPDHIGYYFGKGTDNDGRLDNGEDLEEGEWYPSSWNSSSIYC